jgi:hypothetical protein
VDELNEESKSDWSSSSEYIPYSRNHHNKKRYQKVVQKSNNSQVSLLYLVLLIFEYSFRAQILLNQ